MSALGRAQGTLPPELERRLLDVRIACPDIARDFAELLRHRRGFLLTEWIRQAEQDAPKPVSGFAGHSSSRSVFRRRRLASTHARR
ncbi:hypothetical protein ACFRU3_33720 [Streptomyces sp. NPDC056910]|uniref:hypothetical protein n=1 Tax=Streptomyces sp. NPDC056910 TaxID=3345964 RepID=UPI0036B4A952